MNNPASKKRSDIALGHPEGDPHPTGQGSDDNSLRAFLYDCKGIKALPASKPLVRDLLFLDTLAVLYGAPKLGKTFAAIDLALCVATGRSWHGLDVERGPVLYVIAEGASDCGCRLDAWEEIHRVEGPENFSWIARSVNFFQRQVVGTSLTKEVADLLEIAKEREPAFIVIDTLARCCVGADENSSRDMGIVIDNLDYVRQETGACVMVVHHTGKDAGRGMRGSSALLGAVNTAISAKSSKGKLVVTSEAQKDAESGLSFTFRLKKVNDSVVLHPVGTATDEHSAGVERKRVAMRQALADLRKIDQPSGNSFGEWLKASKIKKSTLARYRIELLKEGLILDVSSGGPPRWRPSDD